MVTKIKTKLNNTTSYVAYGKAKIAQWDCENKLEGHREKVKQASRIAADNLVADGADQIDLIFEPKKDKPFRKAIVNAFISSMSVKKQSLFKLNGEELKKRASKEMISWCSPSYIALQYAQVEKSEKRTFIRKSDVKNFFTKNIGTAIDDLKAMVAYRLGEEKLSAKDARAGIVPTKRADKKPTKKERVDTAPKSDKEVVKALANELQAKIQNSKDGSFNVVEALVCIHRLNKALK